MQGMRHYLVIKRVEINHPEQHNVIPKPANRQYLATQINFIVSMTLEEYLSSNTKTRSTVGTCHNLVQISS